MPTGPARPRRRAELTFEEIEETGEFVVVDPADQKARVLNPTMGAIWILCDGTRDAAAIADEIVESLAASAPPHKRVLADVERCLDQLSAEGLVERA